MDPTHAGAGQAHDARPPTLIVWTWDRAEDPAPVGASIELHREALAVRPRFTRLLVPPEAPLLPVVHIDAQPEWRAVHGNGVPAATLLLPTTREVLMELCAVPVRLHGSLTLA